MLGIFLVLEMIKNWQIKNPILQYIFVSLGAQIFTAPILIYYFGYINFFTFFYNIAISFILFLSLLLSLVFLFSPFAFINDFLAESITILNHLIFFILKKTSYQAEWFTIAKQKDFTFAVIITMIILVISFSLRYLSRKQNKKNYK